MKNDNMKKKIATGILVGTSITGIASSAVLAANTTNIADDEVNANVKQAVQVSSDRSSARRGKKNDKELTPEEPATAPKNHFNTQTTFNSHLFKPNGPGTYQRNLKPNQFQTFYLGGYAYHYFGFITKVTSTEFTVCTGLFKVNDRLYYSDGNGDIKTGLRKVGDDLYYFGEDTNKANAYARKGWLTRGGKQYYFGLDGRAVKGFNKIGDSYFYFNKNGERVLDMVITLSRDLNGDLSGDIYYYKEGTHTLYNGWKTIDNDTFYFDKGRAIRKGSLEEGQFRYDFDKFGRRTTMVGILK